MFLAVHHIDHGENAYLYLSASSCTAVSRDRSQFSLFVGGHRMPLAACFLLLLAFGGGLIGIAAQESEPRRDLSPPSRPRLSEGSRPGQEFEVGGVKLCWCPAGRFIMGSPSCEVERRSDESQVEVTLTRGFRIGKFEVTQGEWKRIVGTLPGRPTKELPERDDLPVGNVNFAWAEEFCRRLTELGRGSGSLPINWEFRLPTEAQWEYACRAGTTTSTSFGDKLGNKQANFRGKPYNGAEAGALIGKAVPIGRFPANRWGPHDMHGNTFEWCRDWYHSTLPGGKDPDLRDSKATATKNRDGSFSRVRRGGVGTTTVGRAGRPCGFASNRSEVTTTSASASSPFIEANRGQLL